MIEVAVPVRQPFDGEAILAYLALRLVPGVETIAGGCYRRALEVDGEPVVVEVDVGAVGASRECRVSTSAEARHLPQILRRVDWLIDGAWDPRPAAGLLEADPVLGPLARRRPGLRIPGTMVPFEVLVRAIVGQQISVAGATTLAGRLVERLGRRVDLEADGLDRLFPDPGLLSGAPLERLGLPGARAEAIRGVSAEIASGRLALDRSRPPRVTQDLLAIKGIGPWTASYVALRALGDRDALPASDLGIRQALATGEEPLTPEQVRRRSERWRPYRGVAAAYLWNGLIGRP